MITDKLDKCPFCGIKLVRTRGCLQCSEQIIHKDRSLWVFFDDENNPDTMTALNIRYDIYQFHFSFRRNETVLLDLQKHSLENELIKLPFLMDFELDEDTIKEKIKTLLVFS